MNSKALYCVLCIIFAACGKGPADTGGVAAVLEIADQRVGGGNFGIAADAGTQYVEIKTNVADWVADTGGAGWLTVEPVREPPVPATGVAVVQKLRITASPNPDKIARTAAIGIGGRGITLTFNVIQAAADDILAFDTPVYAEADGEILEIEVAANAAYTVSIPEGCGWIEDLSDPSASVIRLRVGTNDGIQSRTADLEVAAVDVSKTLTVIQQGGEPSIGIDGPDEVGAAWNDEYFTLAVTANVPYIVEFSPQADWISHSAGTRAAAKEEKFTLAPNESTQSRNVTVSFVSEDGVVSPALRREIRVTQRGYTLPPESVFELTTSAIQGLPHEYQTFSVEIRTGKAAPAITVGGADGWIAAAAQPQRVLDALIYTFEAAENIWPLKRNATLTFDGGSGTIEVAVYQDENPAAGKFVEYGSVTGGIGDGSAGNLRDCDTATGLMSVPNGWPQEWTLWLKTPPDNEFNRLIYHPITASTGIGGFELLAFSEVNKTWYSVVSGAVGGTFYADENTMRKGYRIDFPTVENARKLILRVTDAHGGGGVFGASEIHLTRDYTLNIPHARSLNVPSPPATIAHNATAVAVGVDASVPFGVALTENGTVPDWIAYDPSASMPGTLAFTVAPNTGAQRSATVTLAANANGAALKESFTVVQSTPHFYISSPDPAEISLAAEPDPAIFEVVLTTGIDPTDITVSALPWWLGGGTYVRGGDGITYSFTAAANTGDSRNTQLTFTSTGGLTASVAVHQTGRRFPGIQVQPTQAVWYDSSMTGSAASETIDNDQDTWHTVTVGEIKYYEYRFANNTNLAGFIYYPRDSDTDHGAFRRITVQVVARAGGTGVEPFMVEIPASVYLTSESRRAGWRVTLPTVATLASHLRITPVAGWQTHYSVAEVDFFAPE